MDKSGNELSILLEKFKSGDQQAFDEIYRHCYRYVAFLCSKLCYNKEDMEEAVQDTFMDIFKKCQQLRGDTFLALLRRIAVYKCYDKREKTQAYSEHIVYYDGETHMEHVELNENFLPAEYLENKERRTELVLIINDLSPKQREMIYLYYYAGLNTEEIARLQKCNSVNVRKTLHKARNTIKSKLTGQSKKKSGRYMVGVALGPILFMEAETFSIGYGSTSIVGALGVADKAAGASVGNAVAAIAACAVCVGVAVTAAYFILRPDTEEYMPQEIVVETNIPLQETEAVVEEEFEEFVEEEPLEEEPFEEPTDIVDEPDEEYESIPEYEVQDYIPQEDVPLIVAEPGEPEEVEEPEEPEELETPEESYESEELPEPYEPEPEFEPEPIHIDRTPEILAALAIAATSEEVNWIIIYYGFSRSTQMRTSIDELLRFYFIDDGSGEILIGIAEYEDGSNWRMRFEHYSDGERPIRTSDLFRWMEGE